MSGRKRPRHDDRQPAKPNAEFSRCLGLDLTVRINVTRARRRQGDMLGTASLQQHRCAEAELQMRDAGHELPDRAWRDEIEIEPVSYTHLRAHETVLDLVCRLLL